MTAKIVGNAVTYNFFQENTHVASNSNSKKQKAMTQRSSLTTTRVSSVGQVSVTARVRDPIPRERKS